MAKIILTGESVFIPFRNGKSIPDAQRKPRMYMSRESFEDHFPSHYLGTKGVELVEYAPVMHGRWIDMQEDEATEGMWRCSVCGSDRYFDIMTPTECGCYYCPNCGAVMAGK